jgi:ribosomal protein S18 acetylase RimI-like enzyme
MTVTVRPVHTSELRAVGELTVEAYAADDLLGEGGDAGADEGGGEGGGYAEQLRDAVTRAREAEVYVAFLPEQPGVIAGTVTFCPQESPWSQLAQPGEGELRMLAVAPQARRRGVAEALVGLCVERARELGYDALVLCTLPEQHAAQRLYERLGFVRTPDLDWSPRDDIGLLAYRLELARFVPAGARMRE